MRQFIHGLGLGCSLIGVWNSAVPLNTLGLTGHLTAFFLWILAIQQTRVIEGKS